MKTISAQEANLRIWQWTSSELAIPEAIEGEVIVPAGVSGRLVLENPVYGGMVVGGHSRPGAPHGWVDKTQEHRIGVSKPNSPEFRLGRHLLRYDVPQGELSKPIVMGLRLKGQIVAVPEDTRKRAILYVVETANSRFDIEIDGKEANRSHGALFERCLDVRATGKVLRIGEPTMEKTGQGYGFAFQSCHHCTAHDIYGDGVRYIVSLSDSGHGNAVHRITGKPLVVSVDTHGGEETDLVVTDVDGAARFGNGHWLGVPKNPTLANIRELILNEYVQYK
jgi:hypothetical protein